MKARWIQLAAPAAFTILAVLPFVSAAQQSVTYATRPAAACSALYVFKLPLR